MDYSLDISLLKMDFDLFVFKWIIRLSVMFENYQNEKLKKDLVNHRIKSTLFQRLFSA